MGWDIDDIILSRVRKLLGDRYAGSVYGMVTSDSPVIIRHRGITRAERTQMVDWFPPNIRVEFQPTNLPYNMTQVYGMGEAGNERTVVIWPLNLPEDDLKIALVEGGILQKGAVVPTDEENNAISAKLRPNDCNKFRDAPICTDD